MPVKSSQPLSLWPPSLYRWMAPGALKSTSAQYGSGLDLGAVRAGEGFWQILVSRSPTTANPANSEWVLYEPKNAQHVTWTGAFNRYGPGWSYGPGHNMHNEVTGYFQEVYGRKPTLMEKLDHEHDRGLWKALEKAYQEKIGFTPGKPVLPPPEPPKPVPVDPVPPVEPPPPPLAADLILTIDGKTRRFREIL
jgi:hypothetical protein